MDTQEKSNGTSMVEHTPEVIMAGETTLGDIVARGTNLSARTARTYREVGEWYEEVKDFVAKVKKNPELSVGYEILPEGKISLQAISIASGFNPAYPAKAAQYIAAFPTEEHRQGLPIDTCIVMLPAYRALGHDAFHGRWMSDAKAGRSYNSDPDGEYVYTGPWSGEDTKRQVAILTGKALPIPESKVVQAQLNTVTEAATAEVVNLPKRKQAAAQQRIKKAAAKAERISHRQFKKEVEAAAQAQAQAIVDKTLKKEKAEVEKNRATSARCAQQALEDAKEAKAANERANARLARIGAWMTKEEYRLILNCLHPDRQPEDRKERFAKAFDIMQRLAVGVDNWKE
jgi:hypothetical protein